MTKVIAVVLVALIAYGGWKLAHRASRSASGTLQTLAVSIPDNAALVSAEANLSQAASSAAGWFAANDTYVGMSVPGATVKTATATGYCLEATIRGITAHLSGPNGTPTMGACPPG